MVKASEIDLDKEYPKHTAFSRDPYMHRRPSEAGAADRYYGRSYKPNFAYNGRIFHEAEMTTAQKEEYYYGWANELGRKDYGDDTIETEEEDEQA